MLVLKFKKGDDLAITVGGKTAKVKVGHIGETVVTLVIDTSEPDFLYNRIDNREEPKPVVIPSQTPVRPWEK